MMCVGALRGQLFLQAIKSCPTWGLRTPNSDPLEEQVLLTTKPFL